MPTLKRTSRKAIAKTTPATRAVRKSTAAKVATVKSAKPAKTAKAAKTAVAKVARKIAAKAARAKTVAGSVAKRSAAGAAPSLGQRAGDLRVGSGGVKKPKLPPPPKWPIANPRGSGQNSGGTLDN